jgi:hypothetical protein
MCNVTALFRISGRGTYMTNPDENQATPNVSTPSRAKAGAATPVQIRIKNDNWEPAITLTASNNSAPLFRGLLTS